MYKQRFRKLNALSRARNSKGSAAITEFAFVLYILFFLILVPVVDLGCLFIAAATQYLATNDFVAKASSQPDYVNSLNAMFVESEQFQTLGMAKFMSMTPQGGYVGCGDDLFVVTTDISSGSVAKSNPNSPLAGAVDTSKNLYELSVKSIYSFKPVLNLSGVPILGEVPGLGKPVTFSFVANRPVEHPGGLTQNGSSSSQSSVAYLNRTPAPGVTASAGTSTDWRTPNIYQRIAAAGQTVMATNVVVVPANSESWTASGVTIDPSQKIWVDTQAVGAWNVGGSYGSTDANGLGTAEPYNIAPTLTDGALIGRMGASGTMFAVGDNQLNLAPPGSGQMYFLMNDQAGNFADNFGTQIVRIIVTQ